MYKLQVILVPPNAIDQLYLRSTQANIFLGGNNNSNRNENVNNGNARNGNMTSMRASSNINAHANSNVNGNNMHNNNLNDFSMNGLVYDSPLLNPYNNILKNNNLIELYPDLKKFLLFTKPTNTLLTVSNEILSKCEKLYPGIGNDIDIVSLQDNDNCDLDPDFIVRDVFVTDNIVKVILRNDINFEDVPSVFKSKKKQKLNNGGYATAQALPSQQLQHFTENISSTTNIPSNTNASLNANGGITIIKKRQNSANNMIKASLANSAMRISTPLAHQIYPPPNKQTNNSDDENDDDNDMDNMDRSFLPPPHQPQSPPIRISSDIDNRKRIKSMIEEDTVSKSETVDPVKAKQQRIYMGTPIRNTMTPNRVTLTGQRVMSENRYPNIDAKLSIFANGRSVSSATQFNNKIPLADSRITSGMLSIPEPKLAEVEKKLYEGPSSPSSILPLKADRIPMKEAYIPGESDLESDAGSQSSSDFDSSIGAESSLKEKDIISAKLEHINLNPAENDSPLANNHGLHNKRIREDESLSEPPSVKLAALPLTGKSKTESTNKETDKVSNEQSTETHQKLNKISTLKDNNISLIHSTTEKKVVASKTTSLPFEEIASQSLKINSKSIPDAGSKKPNNLNKSEILSMVDGNDLDLSKYFKNSKGNSTKKPYTTVLHKDIDNSKPDPRNILPARLPRNAARRAAEKLSTKYEAISKFNTNDHSSSESESGSGSESDNENDSDRIESDTPTENIQYESKNRNIPPKNGKKIVVRENNEMKELNIRDLDAAVVISENAKSPEDVNSNNHKKDTFEKVVEKEKIDEIKKGNELTNSEKLNKEAKSDKEQPTIIIQDMNRSNNALQEVTNTSAQIPLSNKKAPSAKNKIPDRDVAVTKSAPSSARKQKNVPVFEEHKKGSKTEILRKPGYLESDDDSEIVDTLSKSKENQSVQHSQSKSQTSAKSTPSKTTIQNGNAAQPITTVAKNRAPPDSNLHQIQKINIQLSNSDDSSSDNDDSSDSESSSDEEDARFVSIRNASVALKKP